MIQPVLYEYIDQVYALCYATVQQLNLSLMIEPVKRAPIVIGSHENRF